MELENMYKKKGIKKIIQNKKAVSPVIGTLMMLTMVIPLASGTMLYFNQMNDSMRATFQSQNEANVAMLQSQRDFLDLLSNTKWNFTGNINGSFNGWNPDDPDPDGNDGYDDENYAYLENNNPYIQYDETNGTIIFKMPSLESESGNETGVKFIIPVESLEGEMTIIELLPPTEPPGP